LVQLLIFRGSTLHPPRAVAMLAISSSVEVGTKTFRTSCIGTNAGTLVAKYVGKCQTFLTDKSYIFLIRATY
jgi:hypothetical protein